MSKYRKKPVVIDAFLLGVDYMPDWFADAVTTNEVVLHGSSSGFYHVADTSADIHTLEGWMHANYGDYIIRGVNGELYPCKADIFEKTYEKVTDNVSDGWHTFNELYHHRAILFATLCAHYPLSAWKARKHHDGTMYDGMFIVGINTPEGQATYHYDIEPYWDMFQVPETELAPVWDGHTPDEAIRRIYSLVGDMECE